MSTEMTIARRRLLAAAVALGIGTVGGAGRVAARRATPAAGAGPIPHKYGTTQPPASPRRVVSVGYSDHDPLLALGVVPVAVREWIEGRAVWPWAEDELGAAEPAILPSAELNFEQIAALQPDLIVGIYSGMTEDEYRTLSAIAPTVAQSADYVEFGVPWQEQTRVIGRAVGQEAEAEALVGEVEARFAEARERHPEFAGATGVVAASFAPGQYFVYGPEDGRGRFLSALGFGLPAAVTELAGDAFFVEISRERLDLIDADVLIWVLAADGTRAAIEEDPLYQRLAAAQEGRAVFLEPNGELAAALSFGTVLSLPFALDELVPALAAALAGDPATAATPTP